MIFLRCPNSTYLSKVRVQQNVADNSGFPFLSSALLFCSLPVGIGRMLFPSPIFIHSSSIPSGLLGAKWFMHLDVDEFLYINPSKFFDLPSWLASYPSNVVQVFFQLLFVSFPLSFLSK